MIEFDGLKRLADAATPGPWFAAVSSNMNNSVHVSMGIICNTGKNIDDAAFIAAANPATILTLIARLEAAEAELQKERERFEQELSHAKAKLAELENQEPVAHKGATHCENCGCTWMDDGLNPVGCPYCEAKHHD